MIPAQSCSDRSGHRERRRRLDHPEGYGGQRLGGSRRGHPEGDVACGLQGGHQPTEPYAVQARPAHFGLDRLDDSAEEL